MLGLLGCEDVQQAAQGIVPTWARGHQRHQPAAISGIKSPAISGNMALARNLRDHHGLFRPKDTGHV
jgi:hypothetical protein